MNEKAEEFLRSRLPKSVPNIEECALPDEATLSEILEYYALVTAERFTYLTERSYGDDDFKQVAPWIKRAQYELAYAEIDPIMSACLKFIRSCTKESILANRSFFKQELDKFEVLSEETKEALLFSAITGRETTINMVVSIDEPFYFDTSEKVFGPSLYAAAMKGKMSKRPTGLNIHVGRYSTKDDIMWFVEKYWAEIEKLTGSKKNKTKRRPTLLRHLAARVLIDNLGLEGFDREIFNALNKLPDSQTKGLEFVTVAQEKVIFKKDVEKSFLYQLVCVLESSEKGFDDGITEAYRAGTLSLIAMEDEREFVFILWPGKSEKNAQKLAFKK